MQSTFDPKETQETLRAYEEEAVDYRKRRHPQWTENYMLSRDMVITNRLTQRQSVNVPLMKSVLSTIMKDIDDPPMLRFRELGNDEQKEIFFNAYWDKMTEDNKLIIKDRVDKKQMLTYGRSFKQLNFINGKFWMGIDDPQDILISKGTDPTNIDTCRCFTRQHIIKPLSTLKLNPKFDAKAVGELMKYMDTKRGLIKAEENQQTSIDKNQRAVELGITNANTPYLGETNVEMSVSFLMRYSEYLDEEEYWLIVRAENNIILLEEPLTDSLGETRDDFWRTHIPEETLSYDPDALDFWNDGAADTLRTPNKILNSLFSQMIENRTLRNFNPMFYDSTNKDFIPQTFELEPWGWYPTPGNPHESVKPMEIPGLEDSIADMKFVMDLAERATAASSISQGTQTEQKITLGEVQLIVANAQDRVKSLTPMISDSWVNFGKKYSKILEGKGKEIDPILLSKPGKDGRTLFSQTVGSTDFQSEKGWKTEIHDLSVSRSKDAEALQTLSAIKAQMPTNKPLDEIVKRKMLEFGNLNPNEIKEVMDFDTSMQKQIENQANNAVINGEVVPGGQPGAMQPGQGRMMLPAGA